MSKFSINHTFNPREPYAVLMKGRPDEPASWQSIGVYSKEELAHFRSKGWIKDKEFMARTDRARRKDN